MPVDTLGRIWRDESASASQGAAIVHRADNQISIEFGLTPSHAQPWQGAQGRGIGRWSAEEREKRTLIHPSRNMGADERTIFPSALSAWVPGRPRGVVVVYGATSHAKPSAQSAKSGFGTASRLQRRYQRRMNIGRDVLTHP